MKAGRVAGTTLATDRNHSPTITQRDVVPFKFNHSDVRVIADKFGEVWFVANEIARLLGYQRARDAIKQHCKGAVKHRIPTASGAQETYLIPERDVYRLIMRSKLSGAEKFEDWVVADVLPSIRKTGGYKQSAVPQTMSEALRLAADLVEENERLQVDTEALQRIAHSDGNFLPRDAAKSLQIKPKELTDWLHDNGWMYRGGNRRWTAYQSRLDQGHLIHKVRTIYVSGRPRVTQQVLITSQGLALISKRLSRL